MAGATGLAQRGLFRSVDEVVGTGAITAERIENSIVILAGLNVSAGAAVVAVFMAVPAGSLTATISTAPPAASNVTLAAYFPDVAVDPLNERGYLWPEPA